MNRQQLSEAHQQQKKPSKKKELTFISADQAKFKEVAEGASLPWRSFGEMLKQVHTVR